MGHPNEEPAVLQSSTARTAASAGDSPTWGAGTLGPQYQRELAKDRSKQQSTGSYYTPAYLVEFIVQHTLGPLLEGLSLAQIFQLRIADPSCGAGAFLLGTLQFLEQHCQTLGAKPGVRLRTTLCACLIGIDIDPVALTVCRAELTLAVGGTSPILAQLIEADALLPDIELLLPKLDAIVGNPPWGQKNLRISPAQKLRYKKLYRSASGVWDPFKLFVERCHQLLPDGGRWGLVLPDIILLKNLQVVRDIVLQKSAMEHIAPCGQAFAGANIDAVVICGRTVQQPVDTEHTISVWPQLPVQWRQSTLDIIQQKQALYGELPGHKFNLSLHGNRLDVYRKLRAQPRLGEICEMHEGVHTGNCRAKLFLKRKENAHCVPLLLGRGEIGRFHLQWGGQWLHRSEQAINRSIGDYANFGRLEWHETTKVVVRRTGDRVVAAFDGDGHHVSNNMFVVLPKDTTNAKQLCLALVALLNSRFMTWYFRTIQPRTGRLFAELKLVHMRSFPIPHPAPWNKIVPKLARLSERAHHNTSDEVLSAIDSLVETAFALSPSERRRLSD